MVVFIALIPAPAETQKLERISIMASKRKLTETAFNPGSSMEWNYETENETGNPLTSDALLTESRSCRPDLERQ